MTDSINNINTIDITSVARKAVNPDYYSLSKEQKERFRILMDEGSVVNFPFINSKTAYCSSTRSRCC